MQLRAPHCMQLNKSSIMHISRIAEEFARNVIENARNKPLFHTPRPITDRAVRFFQILAVAVQPRGFFVELDPINRVAVVTAVFVHCYIRPFGHASVWREIQFRQHAGQAEAQLRQLLAKPADCIPGTLPQKQSAAELTDAPSLRY